VDHPPALTVLDPEGVGEWVAWDGYAVHGRTVATRCTVAGMAKWEYMNVAAQYGDATKHRTLADWFQYRNRSGAFGTVQPGRMGS
jgi:hypothetical protein